MTQYVPRDHEGLTCPIAHLFYRAGIAEAGGSDQLWGTKRSQTRTYVKQGRRCYWWWWHRWQVGGSLDLCKQPAWRFATFVIFLTRTCSSWPSVARVAVLGEGSVHTWGDTARSGLTFRASAPETWYPTLPPIGQWKLLRKRKSLPHIWIQTWYHWTSHL